jgi:hypothetical protein
VDDQRFDAITQTLRDGATRRAVFRLLAGGTLGSAVGWLALSEDGEAKRKKKKRHKGDRCYDPLPIRCSPTASHPNDFCFPRGAVCCGAALGGGACPAGSDCCPPTQGAPEGNCAGVDEVCCSVAGGGGSCPTALPVCCGPTPAEPIAQCIPAGFQCCPFGGYCYDDEACCAPSPAFPEGICVPKGWPCPRSAVAESDQRFAPIRRVTSVARLERRRLAVAR